MTPDERAAIMASWIPEILEHDFSDDNPENNPYSDADCVWMTKSEAAALRAVLGAASAIPQLPAGLPQGFEAFLDLIGKRMPKP